MKVLISGWFSFPYCHATAGDLLAAELVGKWLDEINYSYDFAVATPFQGGVDWRCVNPKDYSHIIFVCGPFEDKKETREFLSHFAGSRMIGLNLTMFQSLKEWNPFDVLIERDSSERVRPDVVFLTKQKLVPVVGLCLVEPYGSAFQEEAYASIKRLLASREVAIVNIDTRLDRNGTGLCSPAEIESILARMDLVITTRLHGTVFSLKNGVPTISIEPGAESFKILKQTQKIGWPIVFTSATITDAKLQDAFDYCCTEDAKNKAIECSERAKQIARSIQGEFIDALDLRDEGPPVNIDFEAVKIKQGELKPRMNKRITYD